jgi:bifunctional non-homologous end joining protein LigD
LFTRRGFDWTGRFPWIVESAARLKITSLVIDGEAVYCGKDGIPDFDALRSQANDQHVCLMAFDLMELNGEDWRQQPLLERKSKLSRLLARARRGLRYVEHLAGDGPLIFEHACKLGLEGIVSKRLDSRYRSGRSRNWIKIRNPQAPAALRIEEGSF